VVISGDEIHHRDSQFAIGRSKNEKISREDAKIRPEIDEIPCGWSRFAVIDII
jgi:hypothetical protein